MPTENPGQNIYGQVEQAADFYQPAVYELLSFYHALENQQEPLDGQFIPLTTAQPWEQERTVIFAVGLLPPSSNVSGKLLDRSASVRALDQDIDLPEEVPDVRQDPYLVMPNEGLVSQGTLSSKFHVTRQLKAGGTKAHQGIDIKADKGAEVRAAADGVIVDISPNGTRKGYGNVIMVRHANGNVTLYAHLDSFGGGVFVGMEVKGGTVIGYVGNTDIPVENPNYPAANHLHFEVLAKEVHGFWTSSGIVANREVPERLEPQAWLAKQGRSIASTKGEPTTIASVPVQQDGSTASKWAGTGSDNAQEANKTAAQVANKDLNQTNLGKKFMFQQEAMINLMINALTQMARTPPLRLLVNPQSFRVSAEKIISDGNWGRNGPIIEHFGDNQDKVEGSGKIAAFYSMDVNNANGPGLTRTARQFSASYQNLLSLWLIYKNNGGIWFPDPIVPTGSKAKNLSVVGSVYLYYDHILYIGSFDNLNLTEADAVPFSLEYSFSFTVRAMFLLDHLDDPQYNYGQLTTSSIKGLNTPPLIPSVATGSGAPPLSGGNNEQPSPEVALPPETEKLLASILE
jgi:murein DD-endopeptidase MepM/ murein hydrolase activator NlpD